MILLEVICPRCKKTKRWLSYKVKHREQVYGKVTTCHYCQKEFRIKGETVDRVVREIAYDGN